MVPTSASTPIHRIAKFHEMGISLAGSCPFGRRGVGFAVRAGTIALCLVMLNAILWQRNGATTIDIGSLVDGYVVDGFHERERNAVETYRWSAPDAALILPGRYAPGVIELRGLTVADGTIVALAPDPATNVVLPSTSEPVLRHYHLIWPGESDALGWTRLGITMRQPSVGIEERPLGLLVSEVVLEKITHVSTPPLLILMVLGILSLGSAAFFRLAGQNTGASLLLALLIGGATTLLWHARPLWVQPYLPAAPLALALLCSLLWWARRTVSLAGGVTIQATLTIFVVFAGVIPLYLLQKYGIETAIHWHNLPILAMLAALAIPFTGGTRRTILVFFIAVALATYGLRDYANAFAVDYSTDFKPLFRGPRSFLNGGPLYDLAALRINHLGATYKYPPFFVLLMGPLTGLSFGPAIQSWRALNLALLLFSAVLLWRSSNQPLRSYSTLSLAYLLLSFQPLTDTLGYAQVDMILLFGYAAGLWAISRQRWSLCGTALALPILVKLYPIYLLAHMVTMRRWRSVAASLTTGIVLILLSVTMLGWNIHITYMRDVLPMIGSGTSWIENQTLNGFFNRLSSGPIQLQPDESTAIRWLTYLGGGILSVATWWRTRRMAVEAGFGLWIVTMLIILPTAWIHYEVVLLVPLYQLFVRIEKQAEALSRGILILLALSWMLLCYGNQWTFFSKEQHGPVWALALSYKFYGLLFLWWGIARDPTAYAAPNAGKESSARSIEGAASRAPSLLKPHSAFQAPSGLEKSRPCSS